MGISYFSTRTNHGKFCWLMNWIHPLIISLLVAVALQKRDISSGIMIKAAYLFVMSKLVGILSLFVMSPVAL